MQYQIYRQLSYIDEIKTTTVFLTELAFDLFIATISIWQVVHYNTGTSIGLQ